MPLNPSDPALSFDDGAMTYATSGAAVETFYGHVDGAPRVIDLGSDNVAWRGLVGLRPESIVKGAGEGAPVYLAVIEGSQTPDFAETRDLASWGLGVEGQQDVIQLSNEAAPGNEPAPVAPVISIASGSGYAGSVYASTVAGQWTADGAAIAGATGSTWTMTIEHEGKAIRCGDSNALKMWTLNDIPLEYRTNGGWWSPRRAVQVTSENRVSSLPDQWGVRAQGQQNVNYQPDYEVIDGHAAAVWPNTNNYKKLEVVAPYAPAWFAFVMRLRDGTGVFANYEGPIGSNDLQPVASRIMGGNNSANWMTGTVWTSESNINAQGYSAVGAPLPKSLVEFRGTPVNALWLIGVGSRNDAAGRSWKGPIWEVLALGVEPTGELLARIQGCLAHQQNISDKLPADHPYKASAPYSNEPAPEPSATEGSAGNVICRYVRLKLILVGAGASLRLTAFAKPLSDIEVYSLSELVTAQALISGNLRSAVTNLRGWMTGEEGGGPQNDGRYPLSDGMGNSVLVPSPSEMGARGRLRVFATRAAAEAFAADLDGFEAIQTMGYSAVNDGGGATYYRSGTLASGGFTADGANWNPDLRKGVYPEQFGAVPGNSSFDSSPAFLAARDALNAQGGGVIHLRSASTYYLSETLEIDPTRITIRGQGYQSVLDWRLKSFTAQDDMPQHVLNPSYDSGSANWTASAYQTIAPDWSGGKVSWTCAVYGDYAEFGQRLPTVAGRKYRIRMVVDEIVSTTIDINTHRTINVSFRQSGIGVGGSGGTARTASNQSSFYTGPGSVFEWIVVCPWSNAYLTVGSNATAGIRSLEVFDYATNQCIHIETPAGSNMRGHNTHGLFDFRIIGTNDAAKRDVVIGLFFDTLTAPLSSRYRVEGLDIADGIGIGEVFFNRAYLIEHKSCRIVTSAICIQTLPGAADAGEQLTWNGGNIGGARIGIQNGGNYHLRFNTVSNDFARQWIVASDGSIEWFGGHLENASFGSDQTAADDQYRIDLSGEAEVLMHGGYMLNGGSVANLSNALAPMRIRGKGRMVMRDTKHYGLTGALGVIAVTEGKGELIMDACRAYYANTAAIVSAAANEVLALEGSVIPIRYFVERPAGIGSVSMSAAQARTGASSLLIKKSNALGPGSQFMVTLLFPVQRGSQVGLSGYWKVPAQGRGTFPVFLQTFFMNIQDRAGQDPAILREMFISDLPLLGIDSNAGTDWTRFVSQTHRVDVAMAHNGHTPAWATHFALRVNVVSAPAAAEIFFDDIHFNQS